MSETGEKHQSIWGGQPRTGPIELLSVSYHQEMHEAVLFPSIVTKLINCWAINGVTCCKKMMNTESGFCLSCFFDYIYAPLAKEKVNAFSYKKENENEIYHAASWTISSSKTDIIQICPNVQLWLPVKSIILSCKSKASDSVCSTWNILALAATQTSNFQYFPAKPLGIFRSNLGKLLSDLFSGLVFSW